MFVCLFLFKFPNILSLFIIYYCWWFVWIFLFSSPFSAHSWYVLYMNIKGGFDQDFMQFLCCWCFVVWRGNGKSGHLIHTSLLHQWFCINDLFVCLIELKICVLCYVSMLPPPPQRRKSIKHRKETTRIINIFSLLNRSVLFLFVCLFIFYQYFVTINLQCIDSTIYI